ncbi:hypothetical protein Droror1_Dr00007471 [Drosera rotundifolia]
MRGKMAEIGGEKLGFRGEPMKNKRMRKKRSGVFHGGQDQISAPGFNLSQASGGIIRELMPREDYFGSALYTLDIVQNDITARYKLDLSDKQLNESLVRGNQSQSQSRMLQGRSPVPNYKSDPDDIIDDHSL